MATTTYAKKDVTFRFTNNSTRKVTVGNFAESSVTQPEIQRFKQAIINFNSSDATRLQTTYFSNPDDNGNVYPVDGIDDANIVITEKTPIFAINDTALIRALSEEVETNG